MIKYLIKKSLSSEDIKKLKQRTLAKGSYMQDILAGHVSGVLVYAIAKDTEATANDYVGWGYIESGSGKNDNYIGVFVAPHKRRKGIGTDIVRTLLKATKLRTVQVTPWDKKSAEFYSKGGFRPDRDVKNRVMDTGRISARKYGL